MLSSESCNKAIVNLKTIINPKMLMSLSNLYYFSFFITLSLNSKRDVQAALFHTLKVDGVLYGQAQILNVMHKCIYHDKVP